MEVMDLENLKDVIDLETGTSRTSSKQEGSDKSFNSGKEKKLLIKVQSGLGGLMMGEEAVNSSNVLYCSTDGSYENGEILAKQSFNREENVGPFKKMVETERPRKKASKRPLKPPRPPKSISLDTFDQKLVHEISEHAMLNLARTERMKMLKKTKNIKAASSSNTNLCAMVITTLFFLIIIWKVLKIAGRSLRHPFGKESSRTLEIIIVEQVFWLDVHGEAGRFVA